MARYIEQGKSIFIPFCNGVSITDSQLHLRMYKSKEMFARHFPKGEKVDMLCEYAPIVRCKDCKYYDEDYQVCDLHSSQPDIYDSGCDVDMMPENFCSYGERRSDD